MGEILLDWEGHNKALSDKLWEFLKEEYLVDFSVTCHGQRKKAHKFVLAFLFPMLKESLRSTATFSVKETSAKDDKVATSMLSTPQCLNLDNIADHPEDMDYLIQFAYTGKATVPEEHTDCLMRIANNMKIKCLKDSLERRNTTKINKRSNEETETTNTTLGRLSPRIQLKRVKVTEKSMDLFSCNDNHLCIKGNPNRGNIESDRNDKTELTNARLEKLRPRTHLKKVNVTNESVDFVSSDNNGGETDNDFDFHSVVEDDESSLDSVECSENHEKGTSNTKLNESRTPQNQSETINKHNSAEILEKLTITDSNRESNGEVPSNERTETSSNDKGNKNLKCPQCDYTAKYPNRIRRHLGSHERKHSKDRKQIVCLLPKEKANGGEPSTSKVKEKKSFKCPQCDYIGKIPRDLKRHLESHARKLAKGPKLPNTCTACNKSFENRQSLERHRESKCGTEPLVCKYCGHKTSRKLILRHHMINMHQVDANGKPLEKNVKCPECDFVCYARHQLRAHQRAKHERRGKFKCKECSFTAPYFNDVQRHDRTKHQNIRDYMCEECGSQYKSRGRLNRHVLAQHKGVKRHKCEICSAEYSDTLSFKVHMQRHEGKVEYKFVCHMCGHSLRRRFELRRHMLNKHGIELEEEVTTTTVPDACQLRDTEKTNLLIAL